MVKIAERGMLIKTVKILMNAENMNAQRDTHKCAKILQIIESVGSRKIVLINTMNLLHI